MNLLSLIIIFLAIAICGAIAFIAWELTAEEPETRQQQDEKHAEPEPSRSDGDPPLPPPG